MEIKEAQDKLDRLESQIKALIVAYEKDAELEISSIELFRTPRWTGQINGGELIVSCKVVI